MSNQLRCCPIEWYDACVNAGRKCKFCSAGFGSAAGKLWFEATPHSHITDPHPYDRELKALKAKPADKRPIDKQKSAQVKKALRNERQIAKRIVEQTLASGRILGDGDLKVLNGTKRVECKTRFNTRNFTLTWAEYQKGLSQGIDHWIITLYDDSGTSHSMVLMSTFSYAELLALSTTSSQNI